jgi:hypothetical protein
VLGCVRRSAALWFECPRKIAPGRRGRPPSSRCRRHAERCEVYSPSLRSRAPISPGRLQASASCRIRSLYSAEKRRRCGRSTSSGLGTLPSAAVPATAALRGRCPVHSRSRSTSSLSISPSRLSDSCMITVSLNLGREGRRGGPCQIPRWGWVTLARESDGVRRRGIARRPRLGISVGGQQTPCTSTSSSPVTR